MNKLLRLVVLAFVVGVAGCAESDSRPPSVSLHADTAIERRATLSMLRRAWADRPMELNDDHLWYERRLLNRSGFFGRKIRDTETYQAACDFWMRCVREHIERYDDDHFRLH